MAPRNILITGASSGLGAALGRVYAAQGERLFLWGRDEPRLNTEAAACRALGALVETACFDLRDFDLLVSSLRRLDEAWPLDLAILNAGIGGIASRDDLSESPERVHEVAIVNFAAPAMAASTLAPRMAMRSRGQIVLIGSIADLFPLPMAPAYAAAKAGLAMFSESLRLRLTKHGVVVTHVSPGFIDTPMSQNLGTPKPFLMTAGAAAASIAKGISRKSARIVVPWQFAIIGAVARFLPRAVIRAVLRRM